MRKMNEPLREFPARTDDTDLAAFEGKIKEKCYELQIKRNTLAETRSKLQEGLLEKYNLERSLEKTTSEYEEVKIQLDVAVQAARRGESERASSREALARQNVQLEATNKDRKFLQEQIRKLQVENGDIQRQLDQAEEKLKSHVHLQETCKIKETQWRTYFEMLQSEIKSLEQAQFKLKEMTNSALIVIKKAIFQIAQEKTAIKEALSEKNKLMDQLFILSGDLDKLKREAPEECSTVNGSETHMKEWECAQQEMELKIKESEKEVGQLQESLTKALFTISQMQKSENTKDERIKLLESEIKEVKCENVKKVDKSQQYDSECDPS